LGHRKPQSSQYNTPHLYHDKAAMTDHPKTAADPIAELITTYNDLNSCVVDVLDEEPSPLEFMRYVARNTPFVVRGAASDWRASRTWNVGHLRTALKDLSVNVAVTPSGYVGETPTSQTKGKPGLSSHTGTPIHPPFTRTAL
jgi:hypothetical protein